ncbi:30S ribosomal protein S8 [Candidatus Micrarchaeota archaeon]|nr:30S ribosomal protein S8 [Candidatus Micrarchaeota archaeon]
MSVDLLAQAMNTIKLNEREGNPECTVKASKVIREVLRIMQKYDYIDEFEFIDDGKSGFFKVKLKGRINNCGVIKPRFPVKKDEWFEWEQKFIPGVGFGILIVSTPEGMMSNEEAKKRNIGGRLIAYVY